MLCNEVEGVRKFTNLGDRVSVRRGCEATLSVSTNFGWVTFTVYGELQYAMKLSLRAM